MADKSHADQIADATRDKDRAKLSKYTEAQRMAQDLIEFLAVNDIVSARFSDRQKPQRGSIIWTPIGDKTPDK